MTYQEANAEVDRLKREYPKAMAKMEAEIGPTPIATEFTDQAVIDSVIYMMRVWCMEVYVG